MGYLDGFGVIIKKWFGPRTDSGARVTLEYPEEVRPKPERFHGRHVLNRYEDGMEKCIGCELCAGVCPAKCIYVRGQDNDPTDPTSPGERFGFVYEINYLRCIHCDLCVEACPTEAITETKLFEFSFTNRDDAIYTKKELLVGDDGRPKQLPWENWDGGFDPARDTSGWMRATSPQGDHNFNGLISWAGELGYGVRPPERAKIFEETGPVPAVAPGHHDPSHDQIAITGDEDLEVGSESEGLDSEGLDSEDLDSEGLDTADAATFDADSPHAHDGSDLDAGGEFDDLPRSETGIPRVVVVPMEDIAEAKTFDSDGRPLDIDDDRTVPGRGRDDGGVFEPARFDAGEADLLSDRSGVDDLEEDPTVSGDASPIGETTRADEAVSGDSAPSGDSTPSGDDSSGGHDPDPEPPTRPTRAAGHFDAPDADDEPTKKRRFRR